MEIPFVVCGKLKPGKEQSLEFGPKKERLKLLFPKVTDKDIKEIRESTTDALHDLSIEEVIDFYSRVGKLWSSMKYDRREELVDLTCRVTGYSREMVELGMQQICGLLSKEYLEVTLQSELGDRRLLDEWLPRGQASVHCQPRGKILHILAGNVPAVSIMSTVRGGLTKNANIIKMSNRDVITPSYFAQSLLDIDPDHPITRNTSVLFWPHTETETYGKLVSFMNAVCVWGGEEAIRETRKNTPPGVELLEFGPRRGIQLIGKQTFRNLKQATVNAAHDLTLFDQEACFSPQVAFVEGDAEKYAKSLAESLEEENARLPKGYSDPAFHANISHTRLYSSFRGHKVIASKKTEWTIVIVGSVDDLPSNPLGRTILIVPVKDLRESLAHLGPETQVVAVEPFDRAIDLREELTNRGVDRVTVLGKMGYFAVGSPHEGMYPLSRMVRWVKTRL
jgi:long-chain-fatty-acyl-CoA reductase